MERWKSRSDGIQTTKFISCSICNLIHTQRKVEPGWRLCADQRRPPHKTLLTGRGRGYSTKIIQRRVSEPVKREKYPNLVNILSEPCTRGYFWELLSYYVFLTFSANRIKLTIVLPSETEPALHNSPSILVLHSSLLFMPCCFFFSPWSCTTLVKETFFELANSLTVRPMGSKNNDCWQHFKRSVPSILL